MHFSEKISSYRRSIGRFVDASRRKTDDECGDILVFGGSDFTAHVYAHGVPTLSVLGLSAGALARTVWRFPDSLSFRKNLSMLQSHVIDVDGAFVGAAVRLDRGYRFIATDMKLDDLDGSIWPTLADVQRLARRFYLSGKTPHPTH